VRGSYSRNPLVIETQCYRLFLHTYLKITKRLGKSLFRYRAISTGKTIPLHATFCGVEVQLHAFITSALTTMSGQLQATAALPQGKTPPSSPLK
jgi:hypothetical protein